MSTVAERKQGMGYRKKGPCCGNCKYFTSQIHHNSNRWGSWTEEKNKRCSLGNFATGKSSWCLEHEFSDFAG